MIGIVNYGIGNLNAFVSLYRQENIQVKILNECKDFHNVTHLILPGVGSFDWAMTNLKKNGLGTEIVKLVHESKVKILGICIGMHVLLNNSEEGKEQGLGLIKGEIKRFQIFNKKEYFPLPHMGWNNCFPITDNNPLQIRNNSEFYFLHNYYACPDDSKVKSVTTIYGVEFCSVFAKGNVFGVQFHPEKSGIQGKELLLNYYNI